MTARSSLATADRERIARRYPPPRLGRRAWIVIIVALAVVSAGIWVWVATFQWETDAEAGVRGFQTHPDRVDAVLDIYRPDPSRTAVCHVFALAENFERVGELDLRVEPAAESTITVPVTIETYRRSTAVDVGDCTLI